MTFVQVECPWNYDEVLPNIRAALLDPASGTAGHSARFDDVADEIGVYNEGT